MQIPAHLAKFAQKFNSASQFTMPQGQAFPRISIGKERFTAVDAEGEETLLGLDNFEFVTVASNPAMSKIHFDGPYVSGSDTPPDCYSHNGYYPDVRSSAPQCESCTLCPHNRWGSAKSNMTGKDIKACQDFKMLAVEPLHNEVQGVHQFRVSPGALKNWGRYLNELRKIGAECGLPELTPDLVITRASWADKNVMGFEFVDCLDEDLCNYVAKLKEANEFESWIGIDNQSQAYPTIATQPREQHQRLEAPAKGPVRDTRLPSERVATEAESRIQDAEVIEETLTRPARMSPLARGAQERDRAAKRPRSRTEALEAAQEPVPGKALAEARALGAQQGERKLVPERRLTPVEIAQQRARASMGRS